MYNFNRDFVALSNNVKKLFISENFIQITFTT